MFSFFSINSLTSGLGNLVRVGPRKAKVSNADVPTVVNQNVLGLQISMHNAVRVQILFFFFFRKKTEKEREREGERERERERLMVRWTERIHIHVHTYGYATQTLHRYRTDGFCWIWQAG